MIPMNNLYIFQPQTSKSATPLTPAGGLVDQVDRRVVHVLQRAPRLWVLGFRARGS